MALAYRTSAAGGGTSGTGNRTLAMTPAVGDLWIVFVSATLNTNDAPTMTDGNGGTYSRLITIPWTLYLGTDANKFSVFVRDQPFTNTTSTTVTATTGSNNSGEIVIIAYSGATKFGRNAIRKVNGGVFNVGSIPDVRASSNNVTYNWAGPTLSSNPTILGCAYDNGSQFSIPPAGWTERQDANQTNPWNDVVVNTRDSGFSGISIDSNFGIPLSDWCSIALELDGDPSDLLLQDWSSNHIFPTPDWDPAGEMTGSSAPAVMSTVSLIY